MDTTTILTMCMYTMIPVVGFFIKGILSRLAKLEDDMSKKIDRADLREMIEDKLGPVAEDIKELKHVLGKYFKVTFHTDDDSE